jgi:hypothetical protein
MGTYLIKDKILVLTFKQVEVNWTYDTDTKPVIKRKTIEMKNSDCIITSCGQKVRLMFPKGESGSRVAPSEESKMIKKLLDSDAWKSLQN